jgi:hypothetical protein
VLQSVAASAPGQPSGRGVQLPSWLCRLQDRHGSAQAVLQQTPFQQWPEAHALSIVQVAVSDLT